MLNEIVSENEEEAKEMFKKMKECGCIDSTKAMKKKAEKEKQD